MAQIGTVEIDTQNNGTVQVPVFDTGDSGSDVYEMVRIQTGSGIGFIPVISDINASSYPYIRIQTENYGICALHNETSLITETFEDGNLDEYSGDKAEYTVNSGKLYKDDSLNDKYIVRNDTFFDGFPISFEFEWNTLIKGGTGVYWGAAGGDTSGQLGYGLEPLDHNNNIVFVQLDRNEPDHTDASEFTNAPVTSTNTWYTYKVTHDTSSLTVDVYDDSGTYQDSWSTSPTWIDYRSVSDTAFGWYDRNNQSGSFEVEYFDITSP